MDRFAKFRITKPLAWIMLYIMPLAAALILYLILKELSVYLSPQGAAVAGEIRTISPAANLLLPGLNPYVPIVYGWIAIVVAVVIHETSHGIVARSLGMRVKSAGLLFFLIVPIGAFVEVDEKELRETKARNSLRVLAAGSGINFIVGLACLALLILSVSAMAPAVKGVPVVSVAQSTPQLPSPAYQDGIKPGDFITAMDNIPVTDLNYTLRTSGDFQPGQVVNITLWRAGQSVVLPNVTLAKITETVIVTNSDNVVISNKTYTYPYLGVSSITYDGLKDEVNGYVNSYKTDPALYILPPSFPIIGNFVPSMSIPFSNLLIGFYNSPLGGAASVIDNLLFWLFFVNFNLAIFNDLPIYPMDGGQAFERFLVGAGRGRISDSLASKITIIVTVTLVAVLFLTLAGPYLGIF
jgi:membrane-associated protease RseP (regulator of RpoE activity)